MLHNCARIKHFKSTFFPPVNSQDFYVPKSNHLFFLYQTVVGTDPGLESVRSGAVSAFITEALCTYAKESL
jgi:hypothetical protein